MFLFLGDGMTVRADGREQASPWHALHCPALHIAPKLSLFYHSLYSLPTLPVWQLTFPCVDMQNLPTGQVSDEN